MERATPERAGRRVEAEGRARAGGAGGGAFALVGWVVRLLSGHLPKPRNSALSLIEFPYVLIRVVLFLVVVIPILALTVVWLVVRTIFILPRAIVVTVASKTSLTAGSHVTGSAELPDEFQTAGARDRQLELMAGGDGAVMISGALDRAASLWLLREQSLALNDADLVRPAMTEGFWRVHRMLLDVRSGSGVERVFDGKVVDAHVIGAAHTGIVDEVKVQLTCEGTCYDRLVADGLVLRGAPEPSRWREEVTLRRSADVEDLPNGAVPTSCPNCGAPLDVNPDGSCRTCHALVAGGPADWVIDDAWRERW